jgi:16S rRNA (guanine1207-N2)-methyltransferase
MPGEALKQSPIRPAEARALKIAEGIYGGQILCTTVGRAQAALELARQRPEAAVNCWFLDDYQRQLAAAACVDVGATNLKLFCQPDLLEATIDLAVLPFSKQGEAELARDLLQSACQRLKSGGVIVVAVDNPQDRWLREQLGELFSKVTAHAFDDATVYTARKNAEPRRVRDFRCRFAFRDSGQLIHAVSRPGVFAHRRIDPGARQLLAAAEVSPGMRILDIGCGSGTVALALAARNASATVYAVDSNARAVECTSAGSVLNPLGNVAVELNATGCYTEAGHFDLAVANPPYYADFRVAQLFLNAAQRSLRPGGRVLIVAKHVDWYCESMPSDWINIESWPSNEYHIISAVKPD